jgi:hypothetical protein
VLLQLLALAEHAGRLDHGVDPEIPPGQLRRVALTEHGDAPLGRHELVILQRQGMGKRAHDRVVVEQVTQRIVIEKVIDRHDLNVAALLDDAKYGAADAAEPVDCDAHQAASSRLSSSA